MNAGRVAGYLRLYRRDVAMLAVAGYCMGVQAGMRITALHVLMACIISLISVNFVYSYNAWADWKIDKENKPQRPIPSGLITPQQARRYAMVLLLLSLVVPPVFTRNLTTLLLFWAIPVFGVLYSHPGIYLKKNVYTANVITSLLIVWPILLGCYATGLSLNRAEGIILASMLVSAFCMVPLKDISDARGDAKYGCANWLQVLGEPRIYLFPGLLLLLNMLALGATPLEDIAKGMLITFNSLLLFIVLLFWLLRLDKRRLYPVVIYTTLVSELVATLILTMFDITI